MVTEAQMKGVYRPFITNTAEQLDYVYADHWFVCFEGHFDCATWDGGPCSTWQMSCAISNHKDNPHDSCPFRDREGDTSDICPCQCEACFPQAYEVPA